jgi:hypothetical protein
MNNDNFVMVAEYHLEPDEQDTYRAESRVPAEQLLALRGRDNRIGIAARLPVATATKDLPPDRAAYDIALMLVLHAHPECRFMWSRLVVDLSPTPGAVIEDMSPSEVEDVPVEVETKVGAGLQFATVLKAVDLQVNPELSRKRTVHFPKVLASGTGFRQAYWDFSASGDDYLHVNRELRVLVTAPAQAPVTASFTIIAKARLHGFPDLLHLRGKKGRLDSTVTLVPAEIGS